MRCTAAAACCSPCRTPLAYLSGVCNCLADECRLRVNLASSFLSPCRTLGCLNSLPLCHVDSPRTHCRSCNARACARNTQHYARPCHAHTRVGMGSHPSLSPSPSVAPWGDGAPPGILLKLYSKIGQVAESEDGSYKGLHMPMDDAKNESKGFCFIEFVDKKAAANAVEQTGARVHLFAQRHWRRPSCLPALRACSCPRLAGPRCLACMKSAHALMEELCCATYSYS